MRTPVRLPDLGVPAAVSLWFAAPGDAVYEGDRLVEVLAGPATFDVSAPATGVLAEQLARRGEPVGPGQLLGVIVSAKGADG